MNRAERRRSARQEKTRTYVLTDDQIRQIKMDAVREATRRAFLMFMSIPIMVLHDKFGFRKTRLQRFLDYALLWFESVQNDETRLMELVNVAKEECEIDVINYERGNTHDQGLRGTSNV